LRLLLSRVLICDKIREYAAQGIIRARSRRYTNEEWVERLRMLYQNRGFLSGQRLGDLDDRQVGPGREEVEDLVPGFSRTFYRTFYRTCRRSAVNRGGKQAAVSVIEKPNLRPFLQRPFDPGAKAVVRQQALGHVGDQNGIAEIGVASPNILDGKVVGQVARPDDLDAVVEDEKPDGGSLPDSRDAPGH